MLFNWTMCQCSTGSKFQVQAWPAAIPSPTHILQNSSFASGNLFFSAVRHPFEHLASAFVELQGLGRNQARWGEEQYNMWTEELGMPKAPSKPWY